MPLLPAALLLACLAALAWVTSKDVADYVAFKQLTESADRQRRYRVWLVKSLALFLALPVACLALLGRFDALAHQPPEFQAFVRAVRSTVPLAEIGPAFLGGMVGGAVTVGVFAVIWSQRSARKTVRTLKPLGDVAALMPRNGAETIWTALIALNAGVSEEVFFRLALPLLIVLTTGNAIVAFVATSLIFGLAHVYQGWVGVLATTCAGVVFAALYLATGSLAAPIALHVAVDIVGLVIRPTAARLAARTQAAG
jgi:membrane protease YdiL (CAAX protease family)